MPAARGVKRAASKSSAATASTGPKNKKKRGAIQLEIPAAPKRRGRVMTCGQGDVGQLGLGEDVIETNKFKLVTALGDKIVDIRAGGMHTVALDSSGKVWTFGCNDEGALGRVTRGEAEEARAGAVPLPAPARRVAAGDSHSAALLRDGHVYAWGAFRDSHGTMGLVVRGREGKACREPVHIDLPEPAVDVASGGDHLVMLTTSGAVYTMGCGEQGQLGRLAQRSASRDARQGFSALLVPSKVTLKLGASRIWAGYHATFVLDANSDKMFAWGLNNYGQLGITGEKRRRALYSPTECDAFTAWRESCEEGAGGGAGGGWRWRGVAAGQHHSLALDGAGAVLALGRCEYGRLGLPQPADAHLLAPVPKLRHKDVVSISASTSSSFAVTADGEIYSWGMGSEGQLGTGACADATEPTVAVYGADRRPIQVSAGGQHTVLLVEDPSSTKEPSPAPDQEMAEQTTEDENTEEEEVKAKRPKNEQEGEISSTSSAQASEVTEENKPQKVNGDETDTPMEVDDTDNSQDNSQEKKDEDTQDKPESEPEQAKEESKPESTDTSSVDTADSEPAELNGAHDGKCSPAPAAPAPASAPAAPPASAPEPAAEPAPLAAPAPALASA